MDVEVALSGAAALDLDAGAEVVLRRGDTVVQNGTRRRWLKRGVEHAGMTAFLVGAHRIGDSGALRIEARTCYAR